MSSVVVRPFQPVPALAERDLYEAIRSNRDLAIYVIRIDDGGRFVFEDANALVSKLAERPVAAIIGRTPEQCLPADLAVCLSENLRRCANDQRPVKYVRTLPRTGGHLTLDTRLIPVQSRGEDCGYILGITRDVTVEVDCADTAERNAAVMRTLGVALPSVIYLVNIKTHTIRFIGDDVNGPRSAWRKLAEEAGAMAAAKYFHPDDQARAFAHLLELRRLPDGEVRTSSLRIRGSDGEYRRHSNRETVFHRDPEGEVEWVLGVSEDVSDRDRARAKIRDLSARMLTLQVAERRRIAQELHDSTGQHLTVAMLAVSNARTLESAATGGDPSPQVMSALDDASDALQSAQREIRVLSFLLHPPEISSRGLGDAIETFVMGFARRAGLRAELSVAPNAADLSDDIAMQLFRVCQEALTNVFRHAQASEVFLLLAVDDSCATLTVRDNGCGFGDAASRNMFGVGLTGMRERMGRLGGGLEISSNRTGTSLVATASLVASPQPA